VALFNCTAKDWREANPKYAKQEMNIRDIASINELAVLSTNNIKQERFYENIEKIELQNLLGQVL
jgi:hypothetical protein